MLQVPSERGHLKDGNTIMTISFFIAGLELNEPMVNDFLISLNFQ